MEIEERIITNEEVERLAKIKAAELETDKDSISLTDSFDEDGFEAKEPDPEQALEFLTGGERYVQD